MTKVFHTILGDVALRCPLDESAPRNPGPLLFLPEVTATASPEWWAGP